LPARRRGSKPPQRRRTRRAADARLKAARRDQRVREVLSLMRERGFSLTGAARETKIDPRTVLRHAKAAFRKRADGKYAAKKYDRLARTVNFPTAKGPTALTIRDSRTVSTIARYWSAVHLYLNTGDATLLRTFRRKSVRVGKVAYEFITDPALVKRLGHAGEVPFEQFYADTVH
jgi:hypothetical protein